MPITVFYAALLAVVGVYLSFRAGSMRGKAKVSVGHGESMDLLTEIRRHGNFAEYVPIALILMAGIELGGSSATLMHSLGAVFLFGRITHPIGLRHDNMSHPLRVVGMLATLLPIVVAAGVAIWQFVS